MWHEVAFDEDSTFDGDQKGHPLLWVRWNNMKMCDVRTRWNNIYITKIFNVTFSLWHGRSANNMWFLWRYVCSCCATHDCAVNESFCFLGVQHTHNTMERERERELVFRNLLFLAFFSSFVIRNSLAEFKPQYKSIPTKLFNYFLLSCWHCTTLHTRRWRVYWINRTCERKSFNSRLKVCNFHQKRTTKTMKKRDEKNKIIIIMIMKRKNKWNLRIPVWTFQYSHVIDCF